MKLLNLGCGLRFHSDWVNVDFSQSAPSILVHDLRRQLPFNSGTFGAVYHSHVLEHFRRGDARNFIAECFRVLESGGRLRVVVPDLELLAKRYLAAVGDTRNGQTESITHHWSVIQLIDQCVREEPGGEMVEFLNAVDLGNADLLISSSSTAKEVLTSRINRIKQQPQKISDSAFRRFVRRVRHFQFPRRSGDRRAEMLRLGEFRTSGEVHKWMYDRRSLPDLLSAAGFVDIEVMDAGKSSIKHWEKFLLDVNADGTVYKPDSLYVEGVRR